MTFGVFEKDEIEDNTGKYISVKSMRICGNYGLDRSNKSGIAIAESQPNSIDDLRFRARIGTELINQIKSGVDLPIVDQAMIARAHNPSSALSVPTRAHRLLEFMTRPGLEAHISINLHSYELVVEAAMGVTESIEEDELQYFIDYLVEKQLIRDTTTADDGYIVTVEGYEAVESRKDEEGSLEVFVAMWFDVSTEPVWNAIQSAVRQTGYEPKRIDQTEHNNLIDDEIISHIRRCKFVVADLTQGENGNRGSVYYQAGFARGLGKQVIQTVRKDILEDKKVAFDLDHYPTLTWEGSDFSNFTKDLEYRIEAIFGAGSKFHDIRK